MSLIKLQIKRDVNELKKELTDEITAEIKVALTDEMNGLKKELKNELKQELIDEMKVVLDQHFVTIIKQINGLKSKKNGRLSQWQHFLRR